VHPRGLGRGDGGRGNVKVRGANAEAYQAGEKRDPPVRLGRDAAPFPPVRPTCLRADAHRQAQRGVIATYRM